MKVTIKVENNWHGYVVYNNPTTTGKWKIINTLNNGVDKCDLYLEISSTRSVPVYEEHTKIVPKIKWLPFLGVTKETLSHRVDGDKVTQEVIWVHSSRITIITEHEEMECVK